MSQRDSGQTRQEIARDDAVASPDTRGGERTQLPVHGRPAQSGVGWGYHRCLDHGGLALSGGSVDGCLTLQALTLAIRHRTLKVGVLRHSDRGSQYAATAYQELLVIHGMAGSMSRRGNCWDNACVESFFGTLKRELIYHRQCRTRDEVIQDIFECIEVFYHRLRRHATLGYSSPAEFEARTAVA
ncbi:MAG: IS3 family transposase [Nitrospirales bacterium]